MKYPYHVEHRRQKVSIYRDEIEKVSKKGKIVSYATYRTYHRAAGKPVMRSFATFSEAKEYAERTVRERARGNQSAALAPKEATDALAIRDVLAEFKRDTGRSITALEAVKAYVTAASKLRDRSLEEAVTGYLQNVVTVQRKDLAEAVREFIATRLPKTLAKPGQRPQLNPIYHRIVERYLTEFAETLPGHAVADLTREHLDLYLGAHGKLAPKSRNDRRSILKMFFGWCVRRDLLSAAHRLNEADALTREPATPERIESYTAAELRQLLEAAAGDLRAVIALQALAGLRLQEVVRLDWTDVFRIPGHIEVSASKSKTRSRRLIETCPALDQWLAGYRQLTGPVWTTTPTMQGCITAMARFRESLAIPSKRNGLRHGFVSAHLAVHQDAAYTAMQAGNSPTVIDPHYKELMTAAEGKTWFAVAPAPAAANIIPLKQSAA